MLISRNSRHAARMTTRLYWCIPLAVLASVGCAGRQAATDSDVAGARDPAVAAGSAAPSPASPTDSTGQGAGRIESTQLALYSNCWLCPPGEEPSGGHCTRATQDVCDDAPEAPPPPTQPLHDDCRTETTCDPDPNNPPTGCIFGFCANCKLFSTCVDTASTMNGVVHRCPDGPCSTWGL